MAEDTQVVCRFVTRMPEEYRITATPFAVPARLSRYGLSEVVNHLLSLGKQITTLVLLVSIRFSTPHNSRQTQVLRQVVQEDIGNVARLWPSEVIQDNGFLFHTNRSNCLRTDLETKAFQADWVLSSDHLLSSHQVATLCTCECLHRAAARVGASGNLRRTSRL
eukprot:3764657-Pyramimonas_sp.AAC.1